MPLPPAVSAGFVGLALLMAAGFVLAVRYAPGETAGGRGRWTLAAVAVAAVYLGVPAALALTGALADLDARPPLVAPMLLALTGGVVALAFSRVGDRLLAWPLGALVGFQVFRVPVELLLAAAYHGGAVPVEVTYEGLNADVVTGLLAAGVGVWAWRGAVPRGVVLAWNVLGLVLLVVVVGLAATSAFGVLPTSPRVTLPATWPGVWLPAWLVQLALLGHLLVFRALARERAAPPAPQGGAVYAGGGAATRPRPRHPAPPGRGGRPPPSRGRGGQSRLSPSTSNSARPTASLPMPPRNRPAPGPQA